jgi:hypothetical protein
LLGTGVRYIVLGGIYSDVLIVSAPEGAEIVTDITQLHSWSNASAVKERGKHYDNYKHF